MEDDGDDDIQDNGDDMDFGLWRRRVRYRVRHYNYIPPFATFNPRSDKREGGPLRKIPLYEENTKG